MGPYRLLDASKNEIRVLHLKPGNSGDDMSVRLEVVSLYDHSSYEALSYVWGTTLSPKPTLVNGFYQLQVTINQQDITERSLQVPLLDDIYTSAIYVLI
ncbi:hypothetical protein BU25DRAFT_349274 [Macroventuria anomochaeta]|uniref:Uncharacterized protein n=1 Tax=Macroventuria anomochaeta TaxID=301207 RepID=A0ACB6RPX0_9PLEO|nr:uncharacterized protein BU25DRAFT_349274 [Macroventuria anomochaeta]KAF2623926.1 hypothetical protein BU25DRAFT_349274 [Macroventuria anomochaeta]